MNAYRIHITGWIASFRYPIFISGTQPTLPVIPVSTIYGMISAAYGEIVTPYDIDAGYIFQSNGKGVDLETIYELGKSLKAKSNIVKRHFLFNPSLYLYIKDINYAKAFRKPSYPLLIGRSSELVMVNEVKEVELQVQLGVRLGGTLLPFPMDGIHGSIQALPTHFTNEIPRRTRGTQPFYIVDKFIQYDRQPLPYDKEKDWGVWFHKSK